MATEIRTEGPQWFYIEGEGDDAALIYTHDRDEATGTRWVHTSIHPIDGHEFGMMTSFTEVMDSIKSWGSPMLREVQRAFDNYLRDNPDGLEVAQPLDSEPAEGVGE